MRVTQSSSLGRHPGELVAGTMDLTERPPDSFVVHVTQVDDAVTVVHHQAGPESTSPGNLQVREADGVVGKRQLTGRAGERVAPDTAGAVVAFACGGVFVHQGNKDAEVVVSSRLECCRIDGLGMA